MSFKAGDRFSQAACRKGAAGRFEKYKTDRIYRPDAGHLLRTITIEDHVRGCSKRMVVYQAARKNQVYTVCFGSRGNPVGWDKIVRRLRMWLVIRWLEV